MRTPTLCICENKGADQLRSNCDHTFVFATRIVQFLYFLSQKFPASCHLKCLDSSVCVDPGPVRKIHCWFSRVATHIMVARDNKVCIK